MTLRLVVAAPGLPAVYDLDPLFDADAHTVCHEIYDWGDCHRTYFVIERSPEEEPV